MLSGNGRHRRPRQAPAVVVAAGVTGSALALPLLAATSASATDGAQWDRLAECESGGVWSADFGNGYYGGLQFDQATWEEFGGLAYAPSADLASRSEQIAVAEQALAARGDQAWATCGPIAGLGLGAQSPEARDVPGGGGEGAGRASSGGSGDSGAAAGAGESGTSGGAGASDRSDRSDRPDEGRPEGSGEPGGSGGEGATDSDAFDPSAPSGPSDPSTPFDPFGPSGSVGSLDPSAPSGAEDLPGASEPSEPSVPVTPSLPGFPLYGIESDWGFDAPGGGASGGLDIPEDLPNSGASGGAGGSGDSGEAGATDGTGESAEPGKSPEDPTASPDGPVDASAGGRHRGDRAADDSADAERTSSGRHASSGDDSTRDAGDSGDDAADETDTSDTAGASGGSDATGAKDATYIVRPGDTLRTIADEQQVEGGWASLYEGNRKAIGDDPNLIVPGQGLRLGGK